jgi:hypothetical protein
MCAAHHQPDGGDFKEVSRARDLMKDEIGFRIFPSKLFESDFKVTSVERVTDGNRLAREEIGFGMECGMDVLKEKRVSEEIEKRTKEIGIEDCEKKKEKSDSDEKKRRT